TQPKGPIGNQYGTVRIAVLLVEDFSMMAFSSFIEPLRAANRTLEKICYEWMFLSCDGAPVTASNGARILVERGLSDPLDCDVVCLISGINVTDHCSDALTDWLKARAKEGVMIGALSTATYILAKAGLLDGRKCTTHWEGLDSFSETFPDLVFTGSLYEIDGDRFTCAGGTSALELVLYWIGERYGARAKASISDQFLHGLGREASEPQKADSVGRYGIQNEKLLAVVSLMGENLEEPLSREELADKAGVTVRQLERLFSKYLKTSPSHYYLKLRLDRARYLLRQSTMPISEIALTCGFVNFSHFARSYRTRFDHSPSEERGERR
ncbi:MAG: GlxA family transcriptional regulator, partial [Alphaproteobacteria bacterium]|nr:GlxA family transcriptional regulator [Alphaproteobacteria bacterium]